MNRVGQGSHWGSQGLQGVMGVTGVHRGSLGSLGHWRSVRVTVGDRGVAGVQRCQRGHMAMGSLVVIEGWGHRGFLGSLGVSGSHIGVAKGCFNLVWFSKNLW